MILDKIKNKYLYQNIHQRFSEVFKYIDKTNFSEFSLGKVNIKGDEIFVLVNEYTTKENELNVLEAHRKYIDLQYMIEGTETIEYEVMDGHRLHQEYNEEDDYSLFTPKNSTKLTLSRGEFVVFYPQDLHLPGIAFNDKSEKIKKLVFKILID